MKSPTLSTRIPGDWWFHVLAAATVGFGIALRVIQYLAQEPTWYDESAWALLTLTKPLDELLIRPVGYLWVTRWVMTNTAVNELTLRLLPFVGAVGSQILVWGIARHLFSSRFAQWVAIFLFAVHFWFIDYAAEGKPYSFELFSHLLIVWMVLKYLARPTLILAIVVGASATAGFFFAYNLAFLYPALFTVCFFRAVRNRPREAARREGLAVAIGAAMCFLVVVGVYGWLLAPSAEFEFEGYYSRSSNTFYDPTNPLHSDSSQISWLAQRVFDLAESPLLTRRWIGTLQLKWDSRSQPSLKGGSGIDLKRLQSMCWIFLYILALAHLIWKRRWNVLALLVSPTLFAIAFNVAGRWPFGLFRINLFLIGYFLLMGVVGIEAFILIQRGRWQWLSKTLVLALFVAPPLAWGFEWYDPKSWTRSDTRVALAQLREIRRLELRADPGAPRRPLYMDLWSCDNFEFYSRWHAAYREAGAAMHRDFDVRCERFFEDITEALSKQREPVAWLALSRPPDIRTARKQLSEHCRSAQWNRKRGKTPFLVRCVPVKR